MTATRSAPSAGGRGAAQLGAPEAMYNLGLLLKGSEPKKAQAWLEQAAALGDTSAMFMLWRVLRRNHRRQAKRWLERAGHLDEPAALNAIGERRQLRQVLLHPTREPDEAARRLFTRAADLGDAGGMRNLAWTLWRYGDHDGAERWYRSAADNRDRMALFWLAVITAPREPDRAKALFEQAAPNRHSRILARLVLYLGAARQSVPATTQDCNANAGPSHVQDVISRRVIPGLVAAGALLVAARALRRH